MALEPSVAALQPAAAPMAPNQVGIGGRFATGQQVEGMGGSPFVNLSGQWRAANEGGMGAGPGQGNLNQWLRQGGTPILFTPLVALAAASYPALADVQSEQGFAATLSQTDLQRGVGVYEYYMKVTSGSFANQGSVVNRFS